MCALFLILNDKALVKYEILFIDSLFYFVKIICTASASDND